MQQQPHRPISPAAADLLVSLWRQQQQQAALGMEPAWQQQQQQQRQSSAVLCCLEGVRISPYGITSQIAGRGTSSLQQQQQQLQLRTQPEPAAAAARDVAMQDAAAATSSAAAPAAAAAELPLSCPVLLVRRYWGSCKTPGWSLLVPAGWVGPFWQAITFAGACIKTPLQSILSSVLSVPQLLLLHVAGECWSMYECLLPPSCVHL